MKKGFNLKKKNKKNKKNNNREWQLKRKMSFR